MSNGTVAVGVLLTELVMSAPAPAPTAAPAPAAANDIKQGPTQSKHSKKTTCLVCKKPGDKDDMYRIQGCKKHSMVHHECIKCSCCCGIAPPPPQPATVQQQQQPKINVSTAPPTIATPIKRVDFESILKECQEVTDERINAVSFPKTSPTYHCSPSIFEISLVTKREKSSKH